MHNTTYVASIPTPDRIKNRHCVLPLANGSYVVYDTLTQTIIGGPYEGEEALAFAYDIAEVCDKDPEYLRRNPLGKPDNSRLGLLLYTNRPVTPTPQELQEQAYKQTRKALYAALAKDQPVDDELEEEAEEAYEEDAYEDVTEQTDEQLILTQLVKQQAQLDQFTTLMQAIMARLEPTVVIDRETYNALKSDNQEGENQ